MVSMVLLRLGVGCTLQSVNDLRTKLLHSFREVKCNQDYTPGIFHEVYKILGLPILITVSSLALFCEE